MFKLMMLIAIATALMVSPAAAKPQLLADYYGYYPAYVSTYSSPLAYSYAYPYPYTYGYPLAYY